MRKSNYDNYDNYNNFGSFEKGSLPLLPEHSSSKNWFKQISRRFHLSNFDWMTILGLVAGAIYFLFREPLMSAILLSSGLLFYCLNFIFKSIPVLNRLIGTRIRFWHVVAVIIALTAVFSVVDMPAHALFMSSLETKLKSIVTDDGLGAAISTVFTAIRVIFMLVIVAAALFAYNQAQQGNDWRPIASQAAMAIGIVMVIDVLSEVFLGGS